MIDIIIPVYNTPIIDLERCFHSILMQTYTDYKVYIVDDGSKLDIQYYLDNYAKNKDNFFVKHIKNAGVSNARNVGILISNSKYITFLDSDDTLDKNFLGDAYEIIEKYHLDLIIGGYYEIVDDKIVRTRSCLPGFYIYDHDRLDLFFQKLLSGKTNEDNIEIGDCPTGRIYTRLFRRDSIKDIQFNTNIKMSEDTLFMIDYMYNRPRIGIIDKIWYNYYINDYSISRGTNRDELIENIEEFISEIFIREQKEDDDKIKQAYLLRIDKAKLSINHLKKHGK